MGDVPEVDVEADDDGLVATISAATWELHLRGTRAELLALRDVGGARWEDRTSLAVGRSAGARVHWSADPGADTVTALLSTTDDELWDVALTMPASVVADLVALVVSHGAGT